MAMLVHDSKVRRLIPDLHEFAPQHMSGERVRLKLRRVKGKKKPYTRNKRAC